MGDPLQNRYNYIWKILGCCGNTKRYCLNAPYCRNIVAIPCNGHCRNVAATVQLRLRCRSIAAIPRCHNIAAMPWGIADYLKSTTYPPPRTVPELKL